MPGVSYRQRLAQDVIRGTKLAQAALDLQIHTLLLLIGDFGSLDDSRQAGCDAKGGSVLLLDPVQLIGEQQRLQCHTSIEMLK